MRYTSFAFDFVTFENWFCILDGKERTWCLDKLCEFIHSPLKNLLHLPTLSQSEKEDSPLSNLLKALPKLLLKQYEYEDQYVKRGKQLMYSPFFKVSTRSVFVD